MSFYLWLTGNVLFLITTFVYIWFVNPNPSLSVQIGQLFAQLAIVLFLLNINMYFIFLVIRKLKNRKVIVSLAKFSKRLMKSHIYTALIGTTLIVLHGGIMAYSLGNILGFTHFKVISGFLAILILGITIFAGYLRHKKSSGFRRRFHQRSALLFLLIFIIHIFIPV